MRSDWMVGPVENIAKEPGVGDSDKQGLEGRGPVHGADLSDLKL